VSLSVHMHELLCGSDKSQRRLRGTNA